MKNSTRFFYFCSINTKVYGEIIKQPLHIGAATNKVLSVISALRCVGCSAYAISLPVLGKNSNIKFVGSKLFRNGKKPTVFLPVTSNPIFRRLLGAFYYAIFSWFYLKPRDKVIIYNYAPEYLFALLILNLKGNPAIIDVEDAPHHKPKHIRQKLNKLIYYISLILCQKRYVTVSMQVAHNYKLTPSMVVYGAVKNQSSQDVVFINDTNTFRVLYGGTICNDTGLKLFCETVELLSKKTFQSNWNLVFVITGFGGEKEIKKVQSKISTSQVCIERMPDLPFSEYQSVLGSCHAALCLKMPDSEIGTTTFPSKVVEITSAGLLLISTKVSDIPILFNNKNAVLLKEATPEKLYKALNWALNNQEECKIISMNGQLRAIELFNEKQVGKKMREFIFQ